MSGLLQDIKLIGEESPWLSGLRKSGRDAFLSQGVPTAKTEAWKYTKPRELNSDDFILTQGLVKKVKSINIPFSCYQIRFENGWFCPAESDLPQGVEVIPLIEAAMFHPELHKYFGSLADIVPTVLDYLGKEKK